MAFFALYICYCIVIRFVVGWVSGFRWTWPYLRLLMLYSAAILTVFAAPLAYGPIPALLLNCTMAALVTAYSGQALFCLLGPESVRRAWSKVRSRLGLSTDG